MLDDLYGPRDLLRRGLLPPELVFGHPGFLRACDEIRLPGEQQLFTYAADLGRDADGALRRARRPHAGAVGLRATRSRTARSSRGCSRASTATRRCTGWRRSSARCASRCRRSRRPASTIRGSSCSRPGPWNETAFEHAVLASHARLPARRGLRPRPCARDGVWMRSLGRLEPVHVILRRVDALVLRPARAPARLAARRRRAWSRRRARGAVSVVNTLGSSVLENPALLRVPAAPRRAPARRAAAAARRADLVVRRRRRRAAHVLAHLDQLVLRPIVARAPARRRCFGWELSARRARRRCAARIEAQPAGVGRPGAAARWRRAPTLDRRRARAAAQRAAGVRGRRAATPTSSMPGGLTRVAPDGGARRGSPTRPARSARTRGCWRPSPSG